MRVALSYVNKLIVLLAALQILNLSVCGGDGSDGYGFDSTIGEANQIDCLVEYVAEVMFNCNDAISENGAHNTSGNHSLIIKHALSNKFEQAYATTFQKFTPLPKQAAPVNETYSHLYCKEIIPPPPKA